MRRVLIFSYLFLGLAAAAAVADARPSGGRATTAAAEFERLLREPGVFVTARPVETGGWSP